jgi:hypothetical protein
MKTWGLIKKETSSSKNKGINKKRKERKTCQLENFLIW